MIKVINEDFEIYRKHLHNYAMALLKQKGSANTLYAEHDEKAKDIVQEAYLVFHNCKKDVFVTSAHVKNYLNIVLYRKYQESVNKASRVVQYSALKESNLDIFKDNDGTSDDVEAPSGIIFTQEFYDNYVHLFLETLNTNQKEILGKLIDGWKSSEIYREKKISRQAFHATMSYIKKRYIKYEDTSNKV